MPESPDFDQIARRVLGPWLEDSHNSVFDANMEVSIRQVAEQLRQVWNARGAADLTTIEAELSRLMGVTAAGPYLKHLDRALRTLDR
jgi:hypothetical protein